MKTINIDQFYEYLFLSEINISPTEQYLIFVGKKANIKEKENSYDSNLYLLDLITSNLTQLTSSNKDLTPYWSGDGTKVYFISKRGQKLDDKKKDFEQKTEVFQISIHGGEATPVFTIPTIISKMEFLTDNSIVGLTAFDLNRKDIQQMTIEEKKRYFDELEEELDYQVIDEIPFWSNGNGFTNRKRNRLFKFDIEQNKLEWLTDSTLEVSNFSIDSNRVIFTAIERESKLKLKNHLFILSLEEKRIQKITTSPRYFETPFLLNETVLVAASDGTDYGMNESYRFYSYDLITKKEKCINSEWDLSLWNSVNSDCRLGGGNEPKKCGSRIYYVSTEVDSSYMYTIDIQGKIERVIQEPGSVDDFDVRGDKVVFVGLRNQQLQEVYALVDKEEKRLTSLNENILADKHVAIPEHLIVKTKDGSDALDAWLMRPRDFDPTKKYPAVLEIHGGPKTVYSSVFIHEMQVLVNLGYVVFYCNPRGSDGRGNKFMDIRGRYGSEDYEDIMTVTDYILENFEFVDENRLGVIGGSYGGYMTNWIIGHTTRFKSAVSLRSISNWVTHFGLSDIGYYFVDDQTGSTPWKDFALGWKQSPLLYAPNVKTPTLFIHSEEDWRCPPTEGLQMFTALQYHDVPTRLVLFKGENHELSRSGKPKHRNRRLKEIVDWFDKYL